MILPVWLHMFYNACVFMRYYRDMRFGNFFQHLIICLFSLYCVYCMKPLVDLQSAVVNIVSNLPSEELSSDGVNFLSSASIELAELLVKFLNMSFIRPISIHRICMSCHPPCM